MHPRLQDHILAESGNHGSRLETWDDSKNPGAWLATIRGTDYDKRVVAGWELAPHNGSWVLRSEDAELCAQPVSKPWTLRPATATTLTAAVDNVGGQGDGYTSVSLYRAANGADRLWHYEEPNQQGW